MSNSIRIRSPQNYLYDLPELFEVMRQQEDTTYTCPDYLSDEFQQKQATEISNNPNLFFPSGMSSSSSTSSCTGINEIWREKICEWCYQVVDHFDFNRQVVAIALNYLDRYLALRPVNRKIFQLAAMTCLFIAIKMNESKVLSLSAFLSLSRGYFQAEHVLAMEHAVLRALSWKVNPPTPIIQAKYLLFILPKNVQRKAEILEITRFLTEISVCDYFFVPHKPSTIAIAALLTAFDTVGSSVMPSDTRHFFAKRTYELTGLDCFAKEVQDCVLRMKHSFQQSGFSLGTFAVPVPGEKDRSENGGASPVSTAANLHNP
uniref:Cyclin N-terminal domain-containing protein n=1 Tax=Chaetoceros debilis TaxID=122233 RepID=A0A7S3VCP7_9STRA